MKGLMRTGMVERADDIANGAGGTRGYAARLSVRALLWVLAIAVPCEPAAATLQRPPTPPSGDNGVGQAEPAPSAEVDADDAVEAYLRRLGLKRLLADQLLGRVQSSARESRAALADRLAKVYVELLTGATDAAERLVWEERSKELLRIVPEADGYELRINLNKAIYLRAEEAVERARLRLATSEETADAERTLRSLEPQFMDLGAKLNRRVDTLVKLEETGDQSEQLQQELGEARRLRSLAYYYGGWTNYYIAMLTKSEQPAAAAMRCFGWLLNAPGNKHATLDRLPQGLLRYEHIARAAVGCAMCAGLRGNDVEAIRWLEAVEESGEAPPAVMEQMLVRRIVVFAGAKRWADLEQLIRRERRSDRSGGGADVKPLPVLTARLLAVMTLDADKRVAGDLIEMLAKIALGDLVAKGEASHVLDLVDKFGTAPIGDKGFIVHYVRGLKAYDAAREAHKQGGADAEEPATDDAVVNQYRAAAEALKAALVQDDAGSFKPERSRAASQQALASYYAGDFLAAADGFRASWELAGKGSAGEESLWYSIVALDRALKGNSGTQTSGGADQTVERRRAETSTLFLQTYPDSSRAPKLLLMRAASGLVADEEALKVLSGVGRDEPMYEAARRQMAKILYERFRAAGAAGSERDFAAMKFVAVGEEVLGMDRKGAGEKAGAEALEAAKRAVIRARQLLDALLGSSTPDVARAENVLGILDSLSQQHGIDLAEHLPEILFRRFQVALGHGDESSASGLADQLRALPARQGQSKADAGGGQFGAAAERLLFRRAVARWRALASDAPQDERLAEASKVMGLGVRIIDRLTVTTDPAQSAAGAGLSDPAVLSLYSTVASAAVELWRSRGDVGLRDTAIRLDTAVLKVQPRAGEPLRRLAETSESAADLRTAFECWRVLLTAATAGDEQWFEARYETLRLLAKLDAAKAREAMSQHVLLYPEYGPSPWGEKLRSLDQEIGAGRIPPAPSTPESGATPATPPGDDRGGGGDGSATSGGSPR